MPSKNESSARRPGRPPLSPVINELRLSFPSLSVNESFARAALGAFIAQLDPTPSELADLKCALSEAVTNCAVHAYPDIIAMTKSGKILLIETKGDHLDNDESKIKAKTGDQWDRLAGSQYRYFMVFQTKQPDYPGAYSRERFMEIIKGL